MIKPVKRADQKDSKSTVNVALPSPSAVAVVAALTAGLFAGLGRCLVAHCRAREELQCSGQIAFEKWFAELARSEVDRPFATEASRVDSGSSGAKMERKIGQQTYTQFDFK